MKIIQTVLWVLIFIAFLLGLLYMFTGSLEWFPTPEQEQKAKMMSIIMMALPIISGIILFLTRNKKN